MALKLFDLEKLITNLTGYIETKIALLKIEAKEELIALLARFIIALILILLLFLGALFLFLGVSVWLNGRIGSPYAGYGIVAGFFVLVFTVLLIFRGRIVLGLRRKAGASEETETPDKP